MFGLVLNHGWMTEFIKKLHVGLFEENWTVIRWLNCPMREIQSVHSKKSLLSIDSRENGDYLEWTDFGSDRAIYKYSVCVFVHGSGTSLAAMHAPNTTTLMQVTPPQQRSACTIVLFTHACPLNTHQPPRLLSAQIITFSTTNFAWSEQGLSPQPCHGWAPQSLDEINASAFGLSLNLDPRTVVSPLMTWFWT